ncbi:META domain-containing protein, partial [Candidatus Kaiserbacteria bacterium]|nr:META domain-containing protein [Candidatus Kaiserbacteria bacterium]
MKNNILIFFSLIIILIILVIIAGVYKFNYLSSLPSYDVDGNKIDEVENVLDYKNTTYRIDAEPVTLVDGFAEKEILSDSASMITTRYFGNEVRTDLNDDGREDVVFLLTQDAGGSGIFYYVVAALNTEAGWVGSEAFLLGDRIAPQTTEISREPNHNNVIVVNYADRAADEPMSTPPSIGKSVWLKLDVDSMTFGTVEKNFSGEANPDIMTLDMQTWTWINTRYNNDTELVPKQEKAFTLTFDGDGSVSATTDCNKMNGSYELDGNQISFGPMAMTRMFCADSQEQEFAAMLNEVQSFFFNGRGELILELKFDSGSAMFR